MPAYNEEHRLPRTLERITEYLSQQEYTAEIITVDDGSQDGTVQVVEAFMARHPTISLIQNEHGGKGSAVKTGVLAARGEYLFLCDADLSMPIEELAKFLPPLLNSYDVAIGSREAIGARRYDEPLYRHLMGRVFNLVVKLLTVRGFEDTQAGFKCFKREVARDIFSRQTMDGWAFDVEILYIAQKRGCRIVEVPIHWHYMTNSRIEPFTDTVQMFWDVIRIRRNDLKGVYSE